jgi:NADP-dependent 3-hydroxy acid dehydrogenase YdfG
VNVLVNNAGVTLLAKIDKERFEEWRQMFGPKASVPIYKTL